MRILIPALFALALAFPASAGHCTTYSTYTDPDMIDTDPACTGVPRYYAFEDSQVTIMSWWVYEETNGICGLQRGDEVHDDTCHGLIAPDGIRF